MEHEHWTILVPWPSESTCSMHVRLACCWRTMRRQRDHAQNQPSLKSIDSRSTLPCPHYCKGHPVRDNEHRTTSAATTKTSRASIASRGTIVRSAITTTPTTHPALVMAMLSFCKQRDNAVLVPSRVHSRSENVAVRVARAKHTRGGRQGWDMCIGQS